MLAYDGSDLREDFKRGVRGFAASSERSDEFPANFRNDRVTDFRFEHIEAILMTRTEKKKLENGRTIGGQVAAVKLRKELLRLFAYAKKLEWISSNPVADAEKVGKERLTG